MTSQKIFLWWVGQNKFIIIYDFVHWDLFRTPGQSGFGGWPIKNAKSWILRQNTKRLMTLVINIKWLWWSCSPQRAWGGGREGEGSWHRCCHLFILNLIFSSKMICDLKHQEIIKCSGITENFMMSPISCWP